MEGRLYGLSTSELQKLAYKLAVSYNKQHKLKDQKKKAGKGRLRGLLNLTWVCKTRKIYQQLGLFGLTGCQLDNFLNCQENLLTITPFLQIEFTNAMIQVFK